MKTIFKAVLTVLVSALYVYSSEDMPLMAAPYDHIHFSQNVSGRIENGELIWKVAPSSMGLVEPLKTAFQMWQNLMDGEIKFKYGGVATQTLELDAAMIPKNQPTENIIAFTHFTAKKGKLAHAAACSPIVVSNGSVVSRHILFNIDVRSGDGVAVALHEIGHWLGFADIENNPTAINIMSYSKLRHQTINEIEQENLLKWYRGRAKKLGGEQKPQKALPKEDVPTTLPVYVLRDGRKLKSRTTQEDGDVYIITTEDGNKEEVNKSDVIEIKR